MARTAFVCALLIALVGSAEATCVCRCVDGEMQPLCSSAIDLPPICPLTICPLTAPSIVPFAPLTLPPLGTTDCRRAQVCNGFGNCRWSVSANRARVVHDSRRPRIVT
jgi:hypothetical protein